jgi:pilus assembly protein CpaF
MAEFMRLAVLYRKNIVISGGTGSGKTTLLNVTKSFSLSLRRAPKKCPL